MNNATQTTDAVSQATAVSDAVALDQAEAFALQGILDAGAREVELPEEYQMSGTFAGSGVEMELTAFRGGPFAWARVTRMRSERVQVLNVVAIPSAGSSAPCFGAELLAFPKAVHLVVFDMWATETPHPRVHGALESTGATLGKSWELGPLPEWGDGVFSDDAIVLRPGARSGAPCSAFTPALCDLFETYVTADYPAPQDAEKHVARRRLWLETQGEEEPAGEFLARIAGHDWVERFTFDVLYPSWLYDGDGEPPWVS